MLRVSRDAELSGGKARSLEGEGAVGVGELRLVQLYKGLSG